MVSIRIFGNFLSLSIELNCSVTHSIPLELIPRTIKSTLDLNKSLNENKIFGAGLDVFDTEPPDNDNPLLKNDKTFLSPHTAAFTEECMVRMGKETIQNIIDFFDKKLEKSKIVKL